MSAFAMHVALPSAHAPSVQPPRGESGGVQAKPTSGNPRKDLSLLEGPWLASRYFFGMLDSEQITRLGIRESFFEDPVRIVKCAAHSKCAPRITEFFGIKDAVKSRKLEFMLATVPDPLHTHLGLFADSSIDAIQKAAAASGWEFAAQWLPWNDNVAPDEKDPTKRLDQRSIIHKQENQPGILIFRHEENRIKDSKEKVNARVLLVFMVGETPTTGINSTQFRVARAYMRAMGEPDEVRVMSPTFSGSFYSLGRLISEDRNEWKAKNKYYITRSGTATSLAAANAFKEQTRGFSYFHSVSTNNADQTSFLIKILSGFHIPTNKAAIIVEDESGYGRNVGAVARQSKESIRTFYFPREIAHLRNAYREALQHSQSGQPSSNLDFSLKDTETGEDSIPTFSRTQTPLSQNAVIGQITYTIRREGIRLVQLNATNVLDSLFLARVLRRECPDTRILTANPDLLFVEAAQESPLTGLLAVSAYPLFPHTVRKETFDETNVIQPDANGEGVLNATQLLLARTDPASLQLQDYSWPLVPQPPQWLLTLGREGFSPVRVWPQGSSELTLPATPTRAWACISALVALFSLALGSWIGRLWKDCSLLIDTRFEQPVAGADAWRAFYIFTLLTVCVGAQLFICVPILRNFTAFGWWEAVASTGVIVSMAYAWTFLNSSKWAFFVLSLLGVLISTYFLRDDAHVVLWVALAVCGMIPLISLGFRIFKNVDQSLRLFSFSWSYWGRRFSSRWKLAEYAPVVATIIILALSSVGVATWIWCCLFPSQDSRFFSLRAVELRFGVSPLWPPLSALTALGVFSWVHVTRLFMAVHQQPQVITEPLPGTLRGCLTKAHVSFQTSMQSVTGLWKEEQRQLFYIGVLATVFLLICFNFWRHFITIDGLMYDALTLPLQFAVMVALLLTCWHVTTLWNLLRSVLVSLEASPLANAFLPSSRPGDSLPIWVQHLNPHSLGIQLRKKMVLHDLARLSMVSMNEPSEQQLWYDSYTALIAAVELPPGEVTRQTMLKTRASLREKSLSIANSMLANAIADQWKRDPQAGELDRIESDYAIKFAGNHLSKGDLSQAFVAFHHTSFLFYAVRQISNLMIFLSLGSVLLMFSLSSYSVQSPQLTSHLLLVLFTGIGVVMCKCLFGMERSAILSRINGTKPGELSGTFYFKLASYAVLPIAGLLASHFPAVSNFLYSAGPTLQGIK